MTSRGLRTALAGGAWLVTLAFVYMLFVGEWDSIDWIGAGCTAAVAAVFTGSLVHQGLLGLRARVGWAKSLPTVGKQILVDFWIVGRRLVRAVTRLDRARAGSFVARGDFPTGGKNPEGTAWRAFVTVASTWSPNSYVVDIDPDTGNRLSHDLVPNRSSESPA